MKINIEIMDDIPHYIVGLAYRRVVKETHSKYIISKSKKYGIDLTVGRKVKTAKISMNND